jgi:acetyl-CoA acetyltransferase
MASTVARTAIAGVGHSRVHRFDDVTLGELVIDAVTKAVEDAGLGLADIDGVVTDPKQPFDGAGVVDGINRVSPEYLIRALDLDVSWYESPSPGSTTRSIIAGSNAVASGTCGAVVAFRAVHNPKGRYARANPSLAEGTKQFSEPYGVFPPAMFGQLWHRYMHLYGTTREQMVPFVVNNRDNALLWEHGYWSQHRPTRLTATDYLEARLVSSPLGLYDCDIPVQACGAFVITGSDRAKDLRNPPAYIRGWAVPGVHGGWEHLSTLDVVQERTQRFARHLFENAGISVRDVDVVNVYDGFSCFVPIWLEALGFCQTGEAFDFMVPANIGIGGAGPPVNTSGGSLGSGRMHGVPQVMESVLQVTGRSGPRQVAGAEIALCTGAGQPGVGDGIVFSRSQ